MTDTNQPAKRGYTVTGKVLAANRENVKKAQQAALRRKLCITRPSVAELHAYRHNLIAAHRVRRADRTYKYCSCFRHGLMVANVERSLVMAGESPEEYRAHLARFERIALNAGYRADSDEVKLARAAGLCAWRRVRAFRLQGEWALRMIVHHLREAIDWRRAGESAGIRNPPSDASGILAQAVAGACGPAANLQSGLGQAAGRADGLSSGRPLTRERFLQLGVGLSRAVSDWPRVWPAITRLNNRFDQLWCTLLRELGQPVPELDEEKYYERRRMRPSLIVADYRNRPAEILANPLLAVKIAMQRLEPQPVQVRPVDDWKAWYEPYILQTEAEAEERRFERMVASWNDRSGFPKTPSLIGGLEYQVLGLARRSMGQWYSPGAEPDAATAGPPFAPGASPAGDEGHEPEDPYPSRRNIRIGDFNMITAPEPLRLSALRAEQDEAEGIERPDMRLGSSRRGHIGSSGSGRSNGERTNPPSATGPAQTGGDPAGQRTEPAGPSQHGGQQSSLAGGETNGGDQPYESSPTPNGDQPHPSSGVDGDAAHAGGTGSQPVRQDPSALALPKNFEEFLPLVEQAFGPPPADETKAILEVTPAKAGVQLPLDEMDSRLRGNDRLGALQENLETERPAAGAAQAQTVPEDTEDTALPHLDDTALSQGRGWPAGPGAGAVGEGPDAEKQSKPAPGQTAAAPQAALSAERPIPDPEQVLALAHLLWDCATLPVRRAEAEMARLGKVAEAYAASLDPSGCVRPAAPSEGSPEAPCEPAGAPAAAVTPEPEGALHPGPPDLIALQMFRDGSDNQAKTATTSRQTRLALYDLGVSRWGKHEDFAGILWKDDRRIQDQEEFDEALAALLKHQAERRQAAAGKSQEATPQRE